MDMKVNNPITLTDHQAVTVSVIAGITGKTYADVITDALKAALLTATPREQFLAAVAEADDIMRNAGGWHE